MARPFLVYAPSNRGCVAADLFNGERLYDVALNDYTGSGEVLTVAEWHFSHAGHKWPVIASLSSLFDQYDAVCFLDDDIELDAGQLNRLFTVGLALDLNLWQAALTRDSYFSHEHLVQVERSYVRRAPMVEIMMPVFSRRGLAICSPSFAESQSGYGLDYLWPKLLNNQGLAVIDAIPARHGRPIVSDRWTLPNGKSPKLEHQELESKYRLHEWDYNR